MVRSKSFSWTGAEMGASSNKLSIIVRAAALVKGEGRPLAIVQGLERALPRLRLGWTLSAQGELMALSDREDWLAADRTDGGFPFICNDDDGSPVTLFGLENLNGLDAGVEPCLEVHAALPLDAVGVAAAVDALEAIGEAARAFWGDATPLDVGAELSRQTLDPVRKPGVPPRGLPALRFPDALRAPEIPHRLGWLNYWSAATARVLGFPENTRDRELLSRSRRTATGGWVVSLSDAPLNLDNPSHLDTLKSTYDRFPEIGGRAPP